MSAARGALRLDGVSYRLGSWSLAADVAVAPGSIVALIGPSGAGKSTLLNLIAGFVAPGAGRVTIDGADVTALAPHLRPVTTLFQDHNTFAHLTVTDNVGLGLDPGLRLSPEQRAAVAGALAAVGLADYGGRLPAALSGGQRQRVGLARALVRRRPLLLLDEPFSALGPGLRREMLDLVARLAAAEAMTVLLVSHAPGDARRIADRVLFVDDGRIAADDAPAALFARKDLPALTRYLGEAEDGDDV